MPKNTKIAYVSFIGLVGADNAFGGIAYHGAWLLDRPDHSDSLLRRERYPDEILGDQ